MRRTYGYARVSSTEQNLDRQIEALTAYGVDERHIISDKQSRLQSDGQDSALLNSLLHIRMSFSYHYLLVNLYSEKYTFSKQVNTSNNIKKLVR